MEIMCCNVFGAAFLFVEMFSIKNLLSRKLGLVLVCGLATVAVSLVGLVQPLALRSLFSAIEKNAEFARPLIVLILTFVLSSILGSFAGYLSALYNAETTLYIRKEFLRRYFLRDIQPRRQGEADGIALIMNDAALISTGAVSIVSVAVGTGLTFIGSLVGALYFFPIAVVSAGILFVLFFGVTWFFGQRLRKLRIAFQDENAETTHVVASLIGARPQIILYNVVRQFREIGEKSFQRLYRANLKLEKTQAILTPIIDVCMKATFLIGVGVAAIQVGVRNSSFGDFLAFTVYFQAFTSSFQQLLSVTMSVQEAKAGQDRINSSFLKFSPPLVQQAVQDDSAVEIEDVTCGYVPSEPVLRNISFVIPETGVTALVGASGSGKTTLLKILTGEKEIEGGAVRFSCSLSDAGSIGVVEQEIVSVPGTWRDNIVFGRKEITDSQVEEIIVAVGLGRNLPQAQHLAQHSIREASGGELQRLMLARALVGNPKALFLDEPTSNVDGQMEHLMIETVKKYARNIPVLIVAHRPHTVQASDNILMLREGKIVLSGSTGECLRSSEELRHLLGEWNLR